MGDFHEALRRQDQLSNAEAKRAASAAASEHQQAQEHARMIQKGFVDLAKYLVSENVPTFQYRHFHYDPRMLRSHYLPPSPRGFIASADGGKSGSSSPRFKRGNLGKAGRNLLSLSLLLPDGQLWEHRVHGVGKVTQGIKDMSPKKIEDGLLGLPALRGGIFGVDVQGNPEVRYGYGESDPFHDFLAKLAQQMRDENTYAWVWEHTGC
ncbi:hypothetical protein [Mycobacterium sp. M23085]|uniref:hypothetical protein n=1 Tax=Mycobacterium sp. M23085 TaxID=3378087 RepID=UPI003878395E